MNKEKNSHFRQTHSDLQSILSTLLQTKELSKISVKEVCVRANINRSTFYYHYQDIYDLAEKTFQEYNRKLMLKFQDHFHYTAFSEESFYQFFDFIKKNREVYKITNQNRMAFPIEEGMTQMEMLFQEKNKDASEKVLFYQLTFFQSGFTFLLRNWLSSDCEDSIETLLKALKPFLTNE